MSTLQVDKITPYLSASVTIEGSVIQADAVTTASFNAYTASQEALNTTFATTGSNTFIGNQVVTGTDKQTFNEPGDNQEVRTISVNSFVDSQGYTMGVNTFGWYHYNSEGHEGFSSNLWTSDYAYGGAWFHDPDKFEYILFPSGAAYDSNLFGLYDNGDTTTKFRVLADKIELTGSAQLSGALKQTFPVPASNTANPLIEVTGGVSPGTTPSAVYNLVKNSWSNAQFGNAYLGWIWENWDTPSYGFGNDTIIGPTGFMHDLYASGSGQNAQLRIRDNYNGTTFAQLYAGTLRLGANSSTSTLVIGRNGLQTEVSGSVSIETALTLAPQDTLPVGTLGQLAVSGSSLYFYDGTWRQVSLV